MPSGHLCTCYYEIYYHKDVIEKKSNVIGRDSSRLCFKGCYLKDQSGNILCMLKSLFYLSYIALKESVYSTKFKM